MKQFLIIEDSNICPDFAPSLSILGTVQTEAAAKKLVAIEAEDVLVDLLEGEASTYYIYRLVKAVKPVVKTRITLEEVPCAEKA